MAGIIEELGIYGLEEEEPFIISALITRDPLLLIGESGSAKTLLAQRIAEALDLTFHAYDASKALFEDIIGFPNPQKLGEGKIEYVPTPLSIWDKEFILIDEISRANPATQNKWLEIIRSRKLMGVKLNNLKYIFSAMNPPGYVGAIPLDVALAGRFAFIIEVPTVIDMKKKDILKIIQHLSSEDAPGFPAPHFIVKEETKRKLKELLSQISSLLPEIIKKESQLTDDYIYEFALSMKSNLYHVDGRRLGMLRRNILTSFAVYEVYGSKIPREEIIFECIKRSLPYKAEGVEIEYGLLSVIHAQICKHIIEGVEEGLPTDEWQLALMKDNFDFLNKWIENSFLKSLYHIKLKFINLFFDKIKSIFPPKSVASFLYFTLSFKLLKIILEKEEDGDIIESMLRNFRDNILYRFSLTDNEIFYMNNLSVILSMINSFTPLKLPPEKGLWLLASAKNTDEENFEEGVKKLLPAII
jgi:MoxR-like ATPase